MHVVARNARSYHSQVMLDATLHGPTVPPTLFIGRRDELRTLRELLAREDVRLVTLTGPGGSGKTRLGLQAVAEPDRRFQAGVILVDLAPISDPALVVPTIARHLGVADMAGRTVFDLLVERLRGQRRLLMLDNFEQVLGAAIAVDDLLRECPRLVVLVTSRAPLQLRIEHELPVPPLAFPDRETAATLSPEGVSRFEAVALFVERARAIRPGFALTAANAAKVAEICGRLDGLPLAIELAAARLRLLTTDAMLARLGHGVALLTGGPRDLPPRQQTLRAAIAWSYELLSEAQRTVFRRLSVCVGGFTPGAAAALSGWPSDDSALLRELEALVDQNLVHPAEVVAGEQRYRMLETIREFALEQLDRSSEASAIRDRHLAWFLAFAERARPEASGFTDSQWLALLDADADNFRAALQWSERGSCDPDLGLRLTVGISSLWTLRGNFREGRSWLGRLLARSTRRTAVRGRALRVAGFLAMRQNDNAAAVPLFEEALGICRELGDERELAATLSQYAVVPHHEGDYDRASAMLEESLSIAHRVDDQSGVETGLLYLADLSCDRGDLVEAARLYDECLALARPREHTHWIAYGLRGLGHVARARGEYARADQLLRESLRLLASLRDWRCTPLCLEGLACIAVGPEWAERATRLLGAAEAFQQKTGAPAPPSEMADYRRTQADARAHLGAERFAAAWARGAGMSIDEAIAYALEDVDGPASTGSPSVPQGLRAAHYLGPSPRMPLSAREREVVALIAGGLSNRQISERLVVSVRTVERHIENVFNRLGIEGKAGRAIVTAYALRHGLIESP